MELACALLRIEQSPKMTASNTSSQVPHELNGASIALIFPMKPKVPNCVYKYYCYDHLSVSLSPASILQLLHTNSGRSMAPKESSSSKLTMKLLVNSKTQRVLYAEAGKDVVDFLFSLLTLPVGTVVKLLSTDTMVGSVGNLYGSVEKLDDTYISRDDAKKALLTPATGCHGGKLAAPA
nr:uncharacterized protein LOC123497541 [Aegilops tauschii subsp. strangulata]